jgi:hypothetical protein
MIMVNRKRRFEPWFELVHDTERFCRKYKIDAIQRHNSVTMQQKWSQLNFDDFAMSL